MIIGITGGIGSGKSMVSNILQAYGAKVIQADEIAREIVKPGMPAYTQIINIFGTDILENNRSINRKKLGNIVFRNKTLLKQLEAITHGAVSVKIKEELERLKKQGISVIVVEAIIPIKHGFLDLVDTVWVVIAEESIRLQRIMDRDKFTPEESQQRIRSQMSDEMYISLADQVIYNNGTIESLTAEIREVLNHEKNRLL